MKRALFVQLPPPRFVFEEAPVNIPLAGGFLLSKLKADGIDGIECRVVGSDIVDICCDQGLVERIAQESPGFVAFSLYVWNVQRSLFVASGVKRLVPDVLIVVGGPEVTFDNHWVLSHPAVDAGVFGEGESRIKDVIGALTAGISLEAIPGTFCRTIEGLRLNRQDPGPLDLSRLTYPYLDGAIMPSKDGTLFLETVRGCPFRCRYCYYHKAFGEVRTHPFASIRKVLDKAYAPNSGVREIYLMDPTFNAQPNFSELCQYMSSRRTDEFPQLHAELRADILNAQDVKILREAGLATVEIGLQSTNPDALRLAGRSASPAKTARGVRLLKEAGIEVTTGIILGLPGDSPQGVTSTLEWLAKTKAYSVVHPFVLAVLPGTDFRAHANDLGLDYHQRPPYYVRSTTTFTPEDLSSALCECEETLGMEMDYISPPSLVDRGPGLIRQPDEADYVSKWVVLLDTADPARGLTQIQFKATDPFTFWFRGQRFKDSEKQVLGMLSDFTEANPHTVVHVVLEFAAPPERSFFDKAINATSHPGSYLNRSYEPLNGAGSVITPIFALIWREPGLPQVRDTIQATYGSVATVIWDQVEIQEDRLSTAEPPLLISWSEPQIGEHNKDLIGLLYDKFNSYPDEIRFRDPLLQDYWRSLTRSTQPAAMLPEKILVTT